MSLVENDGAVWQINRTYNASESSDFADKYLLPYLKIRSKCGTNVSTGLCKFNIKTRSVASLDYMKSLYTSFYLNDGTKIYFSPSSDDKVAVFMVDINGNKSPNLLGRDVFVFVFSRKDLVLRENFHNSSSERIYDWCKNYGFSCSAMIIKNNWQMPSNYPW